MDVSNLKYNDLDIIEEKPLRVRVGRRYLYIKSLPLRKVNKYEIMLANLLIDWASYLEGISILDYKKLKNDKEIEAFSFEWRRLLKSNKAFLKDVIKVICDPYKFSWRYFLNHATYDIITQCFLASQLLNYEAVKKNIMFLLKKAGIIQESQTSLIISQEHTDGARQKSLTPRY